jgi:hypothetical protein
MLYQRTYTEQMSKGTEQHTGGDKLKEELHVMLCKVGLQKFLKDTGYQN